MELFSRHRHLSWTRSGGLSASPQIALSLQQPQVGGGAELGAWEIHAGEPKVSDRGGGFRRGELFWLRRAKLTLMGVEKTLPRPGSLPWMASIPAKAQSVLISAQLALR